MKSGLLELCLKGAHRGSLYEENNAYFSAWFLSEWAIYSIFLLSYLFSVMSQIIHSTKDFEHALGARYCALY